MDFESFEKEFVEKVQEIQKGKPIKMVAIDIRCTDWNVFFL